VAQGAVPCGGTISIETFLAAAIRRMEDLLGRSPIWPILGARRGPDTPSMTAMLDLMPGTSVAVDKLKEVPPHDSGPVDMT